MADTTDECLVRVGDLASAAGLTVRALHHYEAIGLLERSSRTASGYRLYDTAAVARLYQVLRLKGIGMALERIGRLHDDGGPGLGAALSEHVAGIEAEITRLVALRNGLSRVLADRQGDRSDRTMDGGTHGYGWNEQRPTRADLDTGVQGPGPSP